MRDLVIFNGYQQDLEVELDGRSAVLPGESLMRVDGLPPRPLQLQARGPQGQPVESLTLQPGDAPLVVWNIAARGMLLTGVALYGEGEAPDHQPLPAVSLHELRGVDHAFEDPPEEMALAPGQKVERTVLYALEGEEELGRLTLQLRGLDALDQALAMLRAELLLAPGDERLLEMLDLLLFDMRPRLGQVLEEHARRFPQLPQPWLWLARSEPAPSTALAFAEAACELAPQHPEGHFQRARHLTTLGRLDEAWSAWERFVQLAPDHADAVFPARLVTLWQLGEPWDSPRLGALVPASAPGPLLHAHYRLSQQPQDLAQVLTGFADPEDRAALALTAGELALARHSRDADTLVRLAACPRASETDRERAMDLEPEQPGARLLLAALKGRFDDEHRRLLPGVVSASESPDAELGALDPQSRAWALWLRGDHEAAHALALPGELPPR